MTVDEVQRRFDGACWTLLRLRVPGCRPSQGNRSAWPDYPQERADWFAAMVDAAKRDDAKEDFERLGIQLERQTVPTARQITEMDETLKWLPLVRDAQHRSILMGVSVMRAAGRHDAVTRMGAKLNMHRNTVRRYYSRALGDVVVGITVPAASPAVQATPHR